MKIKYRTFTNPYGVVDYATKCPYSMKSLTPIGSISCKLCACNKQINEEEKWVQCGDGMEDMPEGFKA